MAEALMVDTCRVTRSGEPVTDPETGVVTTPQVTVYEGKAKSQTYEGYERNPDAAGHEFTVQRYAVHFPVGSFDPRVGDEIEWLTSAHTPALVGTKETIAALFDKSMSTAMRVFVDREVS